VAGGRRRPWKNRHPPPSSARTGGTEEAGPENGLGGPTSAPRGKDGETGLARPPTVFEAKNLAERTRGCGWAGFGVDGPRSGAGPEQGRSRVSEVVEK